MLEQQYNEYVYLVRGESVFKSPKKFFDENKVYLIVDRDLKIIWIWSGKKSKLFHRYIGSNYAVKLRSNKNFYNFKTEVIKQGKEPDEFISIYNEIIEGRSDLKYPGESRTYLQQDNNTIVKLNSQEKEISASKKGEVMKILAEINEMQMHVKYSLEHMNKRIKKIKQILSN